DDLAGVRAELPGLAVEVGELELGHGPCLGPRLDDVGRHSAARETERRARSGRDAERATASDGRKAVRRAHPCILGDTEIWCRAERRRHRSQDRKALMTASRSPRFLQSPIADAGVEAARAALLATRPTIPPKYSSDALGSR